MSCNIEMRYAGRTGRSNWRIDLPGLPRRCALTVAKVGTDSPCESTIPAQPAAQQSEGETMARRIPRPDVSRRKFLAGAAVAALLRRRRRWGGDTWEHRGGREAAASRGAAERAADRSRNQRAEEMPHLAGKPNSTSWST